MCCHMIPCIRLQVFVFNPFSIVDLCIYKHELEMIRAYQYTRTVLKVRELLVWWSVCIVRSRFLQSQGTRIYSYTQAKSWLLVTTSCMPAFSSALYPCTRGWRPIPKGLALLSNDIVRVQQYSASSPTYEYHTV